MSPEEACRIVQEALNRSGGPEADLEFRAPYSLLAAADSLGYSIDPDLAVKRACLALYVELKSTQSRLAALASGSLLATTSGTGALM